MQYKGAMDARYSPVPQFAIGGSTSAQTANQLDEVNQRLNAGVFGVDLAPINAKTLESIPRQHLKEIERLIKLNDAKASLHGPIADLVGMQEGTRKVSEEQRKYTERQMEFFIDRAHELDSKGNTPINFHINTQIPGDKFSVISAEEWRKLSEKEKEGVIVDSRGNKFIKESMGIINRETGDIGLVEREVKHYPGGEAVWTPERRMDNMNKTQWDEEKLKVFRLMDEKRKLTDRQVRNIEQNKVLFEMAERGHLDEEQERRLNRLLREKNDIDNHISELDIHIDSQMGDIYNRLKHMDPKYKNQVDEIKKNINQGYGGNKGYEQSKKDYERFAHDAQKHLSKGDRRKAMELQQKAEEELDYQRQLVASELSKVGVITPAPRIWERATDYAQKETIKTVSNAAYGAYKKYKDNSPILTLENYRHDLSIGAASELKNVVEKSREELANRLIKDGMNKEKAKLEADKLIGVTWDVGHINFLRSQGLTGEKLKEKILEETKIIAPYVKQVHLNDNFGWDDVHFAPGMGNSPIRAQVEELKKKGFKFEKGNLIAEPGAYAAQFKQNPHVEILSYFDSPMFSGGDAVGIGAPSWYEAWETEGFYRMGYGPFLPQTHFRTLYGAGFTNLPPEVGGIGTGEGQSRFAGG